MLETSDLAAADANFDSATVEHVWAKGSSIAGIDSGRWRSDANGNLLFRESYRQRTRCGWVIAYRVPLERGGSSDLANLRPMHWEDSYVMERAAPRRRDQG